MLAVPGGQAPGNLNMSIARTSTVPHPSPIRPKLPGFLTRLRQIYQRRETIRLLTVSDLKAGHRDKVLGGLWSLLDPLLFMLVFFLVFGVLFKSIRGTTRPIDYMLYILIGIVLYRFIDSTVSRASTIIRVNRGLIHEINFPKAVFPISLTLSHLYDLLLGLGLLVPFLIVGGVLPTVHYLWVPVLLLLTVMLTMGVAFLVSCLGAFFADTSNIVSIAMRLLYYCSPVFYFVRDRGDNHAAITNEVVRFWYFLNPITCLMESWRDVVLRGTSPQLNLMVCSAAFALALWIVGFWIFSGRARQFAKYV